MLVTAAANASADISLTISVPISKRPDLSRIKQQDYERAVTKKKPLRRWIIKMTASGFVLCLFVQAVLS